jgi:phosphoribosylanthranilate isomerase
MQEQSSTDISPSPPQVKICGLTTVEQAVACAELGADAIGLVFYPPSPRFVADEQAAAICRALPASVWSVGVFVNEDSSAIIRRIRDCGLRAVQLHGRETSELVKELREQGVRVIKTLFPNGRPSFAEVGAYPFSHAFLTECVGERLPGGNGQSWNWGMAEALSRSHPVILAGGLTPDNVSEAIQAARPGAVDVSSGVEARPGWKDLEKVRQFLANARQNVIRSYFGRIFP